MGEIKVGNKLSTYNYVMIGVTMLKNGESVLILARGGAIKKGIDTATILVREFGAIIKKVEINSTRMKTQFNKNKKSIFVPEIYIHVRA